MKLLEISAEDAERFERKRKKKNPDLGFSGRIAVSPCVFQPFSVSEIKPCVGRPPVLEQMSFAL